MGSVGDAYDNALCESFFATLECELLDRVRLRTREEAQQAVFEFIEGFYNSRRRHSSLDYDCPIAFEEKHWGVAQDTSPELSTETGQLQTRYNRMLWIGKMKERILRCSPTTMKQRKEYAHEESTG